MSTRPDGRSYIDEPVTDDTHAAQDVSEVASTSGSSGSSVVESEGEEEPVWSEAELDHEPALEVDEDDETWDVDDEDWELADGGEYWPWDRSRQTLRSTTTACGSTTQLSHPVPANRPYPLETSMSCRARDPIPLSSLAVLRPIPRPPRTTRTRRIARPRRASSTRGLASSSPDLSTEESLASWNTASVPAKR